MHDARNNHLIIELTFLFYLSLLSYMLREKKITRIVITVSNWFDLVFFPEKTLIPRSP